MNCETCGQPITSKRPRRFCSVKCRANHPDFKAVAARNAKKAQAARKGTGARRRCEQCGDMFACPPRRAKRFCTRACYRDYIADLFDRNIEPDAEAMSNFDEYFSQDELPCPIRGCNWKGEDLAHHALMAHGVKARALKDKCGFNIGTGLVGRSLAKRLSSRHRENGGFRHRGCGPKPGNGALRPEGQERFQKAMALIRGDGNG